MAMPVFATGPYRATYDASGAAVGTPGQEADPAARDIGIVQNVFRFSRTAKGEPISNTNLYGQTTIDSIYQGADCFVLFTIKEWKPYIRDILWPFAPAFNQMGEVGRMFTPLAGKLVLTPVAGTPAYVNDGKIITFGKAILAPEHNTDIPMGPTEKTVNLVFQCFPYEVTVSEDTVEVWFEEANVS